MAAVTEALLEPPAGDAGGAAAMEPGLRAEQVRAGLADLVAELDAGSLTPAEARGLGDTFDAIARLAQAGTLLTAARATETQAWRAEGFRSQAEWYAHHHRCSARAAHDHLDTAGRLAQQPALEDALRRGRLNAEQATAISDAAAVDPAAESTLISQAARESLAGLRDHARRAKAAARGDDARRHEHIRRNRFLRTWIDGEGAWNIQGRTTATSGIPIDAALRAAREAVFAAARRHGIRESFDAYTADALEWLARTALGACTGAGPTDGGAEPGDTPRPTPGAAGRVGTDGDAAGDQGAGATVQASTSQPSLLDTGGSGVDGPTGSDPPDASADDVDHSVVLPDGSRDAPRQDEDGAAPPGSEPIARDVIDLTSAPRLPAGRTKVVVRIDHAALVRGHTDAGETCDVPGLGPVPVTAVRELIASGDAFLAAVVTKGVDVCTVAHLGRRPTAFQSTALEWRDPHCQVEGCTGTWTEIDHTTGWTATHQTRLDDLDRLCTHHHALKSDHGWAMADGRGRRPFLPPAGNDRAPP